MTINTTPAPWARETAAAAQVAAVLAAMWEVGKTAHENPEDLASILRKAAAVTAAAELYVVDDLLEAGPYNGDELSDELNTVIDAHFRDACPRCGFDGWPDTTAEDIHQEHNR
ncbi:hypothetical protein [Nocardia sp. NPDC051750]|uniref:hypothetical protein n=1 Tax=Nocardia sp. NPDC051750 TaxID=3364325 RepID=UPI0037B865F7